MGSSTSLTISSGPWATRVATWACTRNNADRADTNPWITSVWRVPPFGAVGTPTARTCASIRSVRPRTYLRYAVAPSRDGASVTSDDAATSMEFFHSSRALHTTET